MKGNYITSYIISNLSEKHKLKSMHFVFSSNKKSFILKLLFETIKLRFLAESRAFNVNCYAREKFEDGQILVWEKELFERRKTQELVVQDEKKSALAAKLRALRK